MEQQQEKKPLPTYVYVIAIGFVLLMVLNNKLTADL